MSHSSFVNPLRAAGAALLLVASPATAARHDGGQRCWSVEGQIETTLGADGCTSPVGICTTGFMRAGLLHGPTRFTAGGLGGGAVGSPSIVTPPVEPPSTWSYSGELSIVTPFGELVLSDTGVLDAARGVFSELDRVSGGTGWFQGATGTLFMFGHTRADGSGFAGEVRGEICVPKRRGAVAHD